MPTLVELLLEPPSLPMSQFVATQIATKPSLYVSLRRRPRGHWL